MAKLSPSTEAILFAQLNLDMHKQEKLVLSVLVFVLSAILMHFPLAVLCLNLVGSKMVAFPALLVGVSTFVFSAVKAVGAFRKRDIFFSGVWGACFSFAVALFVVANKIISIR
jgi:hypothetical protein